MAWKTGRGSLRPGSGGFLAVYPNTYAERRFFSFRIPKGASKKSLLPQLSEIAQTGTKWDFAAIVIYPQNIVYELAQNEPSGIFERKVAGAFCRASGSSRL